MPSIPGLLGEQGTHKQQQGKGRALLLCKCPSSVGQSHRLSITEVGNIFKVQSSL